MKKLMILLTILSSQVFGQTDTISKTRCFSLISGEYMAMQTVISHAYQYHSLSKLDNIYQIIALFPWSRKDSEGVIEAKTKKGTIYRLKLNSDNVPMSLTVITTKKGPLFRKSTEVTTTAKNCNR